MGLLDKAKGLLKGNKAKVDQGVDKAAEVAKDKLPDQYDSKVDQAAETVKDTLDKLDG